jgi:flagellar protein FlaI
MEMKSLTHDEMMEEFNRRTDIVKYMVQKDITDHRKIWALINSYYKDQEKTIKRVRREMEEGVTQVGA